MFPGPVFLHELRVVARRRRYYALRLGFGLFLLYLVVAYARPSRFSIGPSVDETGYSPGELAAIGGRLFGTVAWLQGFAVLLLTPALVAGAIGEARERKVLAYLLASPLSSAEIVLGKLAARLAHLATFVLVGLPVVSLALFLGGVSPEQVWLCFGGTISTLFFVAAISIFVSTFSRRPREAILMTYLYELFWLFLPAIELGIVQQAGPVGRWVEAARPVTGYVTGSSPMVLMFGDWFRRGSRVVEDIGWMIGLQLLYGSFLLGWATLRLRAVEQGARLFGLRGMGSSLSGEARPLRKRSPCGDDPMLWKECPETLATGSRLRAAAFLLVSLAFLGGVAYWYVEQGLPAIRETATYGYGATTPDSARENLNFWVRLFTGVLYPLLALFLGVTAATGFTSEREKDTWISLIATPLEAAEILRGKILGAFWRARFLAAALVLIWMLGLIGGAIHPLGLAVSSVSTTVYSFCFTALGTYISVRAKSSARAIVATLGLGMFSNLGYLFCCVPALTGRSSVIWLAGASPLIVVGAACTFAEFEWFLSRPGPAQSPEFVLMGLLSVAFYGGLGLKLLHDSLQRFQVEVDRPRRGGWPNNAEPGAEGIRFFEEANPENAEIEAEEDGPHWKDPDDP